MIISRIHKILPKFIKFFDSVFVIFKLTWNFIVSYVVIDEGLVISIEELIEIRVQKCVCSYLIAGENLFCLSHEGKLIDVVLEHLKEITSE